MTYNAVAAMLCIAMLASCTLTTNQQTAAAKAYDRICASEPPLYANFVIVGEAKGFSDSRMRKAAGLHDTIGAMCATRPTDVVTALVVLSSSYATFISVNASVVRSARIN